MRSPRTNPAGFTLVELVISLVIMSILLGSMASAVILAGHALPNNDDPSERTAAAVAAVDRIIRDLALADPITMAEPNEVRLYVPDRGHGSTGPEKIIFAWSGTAGDPLTSSYNSGADVTVCEDVHEFSLEYLRASGTLTTAPRIVLVVGSTSPADVGDVARQTLMESWGFPVFMIAATEPQATLTAQIADSDVLYISETVLHSVLKSSVDPNPPIGLISEEYRVYDHFGISQNGQGTIARDSIWVVDDTHEITSGLGTGPVQVFEVPLTLAFAAGAPAPGARVLSQWSGDEPSTIVVDTGAELYGGDAAKGRRVGLPWGDTGFDITALTAEGRQYLRRAIVWAAAPADFAAVRIALQVGSDPSARIETQVQLLNMPQEQ